EGYSPLFPRLFFRRLYKRKHVARGRAAGVDNKIRVELRKARPADAVSLEAELFDEPPGRYIGRVLEYRARVRHLDRLGPASFFHVFLNVLLDLFLVAGFEAEFGPRNHAPG